MRYEKWIGYEFASNFEKNTAPMVYFPNGLIEGTVSGYLQDIVKPVDRPAYYVVELRYKNENYEDETRVLNFTFKGFKKNFYDVTALPS